jgi:glycosyltransferase involved in cell wall biosynthesis
MISIIIPAFNERAVIERTLKAMLEGADPGELDIIVVCNGCKDDTANIARTFGPPVRVLVTEIGSKTYALNLGDKTALGFPRIYADADILLPIDSIREIANQLAHSGALAVSPTAKVNLSGCSWAVRACYEIRSLLPSSKEGIGGSGVYALSEVGRARFKEFPNLTADDGFVRIQFKPHERRSLTSVKSTVFAPRTLRDLIITKTRAQFGSFELAKLFPDQWKNKGESNDKALLALFGLPWLWHKLLVYSFVALVAKSRARKRLLAGTFEWQRDETSRIRTE